MATINKNGNYAALPIGFSRGNPIPLDPSSIWYDYSELETYAKSDVTAYVGQILTYINETDKTASAYLIINENGGLLKLATTIAGADIAETVEMLGERVDIIELSLGQQATYYTDKDTLPSGKKVGDEKTPATGVFALLDTKANKSTTLAGYGIEDAYTKTETDALVGRAFDFKGNASLELEYTETSGDFDYNTTYYTKNSDGTYTKADIDAFTDGITYYIATWTGNLVDSTNKVITGTAGDVYQVGSAVYAYRDDDGKADSSDCWVELGTSVDLSAYATKAYLNTKLSPVIKTVGNSTAGLVKDVADLQNTVGHDNTTTIGTSNATGLFAKNEALDGRITKLENKSYAPEDAEKNVINSVTTEEFTIDSDRKLSVNEISYTKIKGLGDIATKDTISEDELAEGLKAKINGKVDKATTLAGYGIGDAKIENGTITLGQTSITPITNVDDKLNIGTSIDASTVQSYYGLKQSISDVKTDIIGKSGDLKTADTVYGAKTYADAAVATGKSDLIGTSTDVWSDDTKTLNALKNYTDLKDSDLLGKVTDTFDKNTIYGVQKGVTEAKDLANKKIASISASDNSVTISGTSTEPTVAVKISTKDGNLLKLDSTNGKEGLYVSTPDSVEYSIAKADNAQTGFSASYYLTKDGTRVGEYINIPKDYLVKSASVNVCQKVNVPEEGYAVGDKYIDFVINTSDASGNESHIYLRVQDLVDTYTGGNGISVSNTNEVSIKIATTNNGLSVDSNGLTIGLSSATSAGAMSSSDFNKLDGIEEKAQVNTIESISTGDGILTISNKGVSIPTATATLLGLVKGSTDENKVSVGNDGIMEVNSLNVNKLVQTTGEFLVVDGLNASLTNE